MQTAPVNTVMFLFLNCSPQVCNQGIKNVTILTDMHLKLFFLKISKKGLFAFLQNPGLDFQARFEVIGDDDVNLRLTSTRSLVIGFRLTHIPNRRISHAVSNMHDTNLTQDKWFSSWWMF